MARNGSGTYSLPAGNPVVGGTTVSSSWANNTLTDIATALSGSLSADGQTAWTGPQNANNLRLIALAAATSLTDAVNANDVQTGKFRYVSSVAGTNTITGTVPSLATYTTGSTFNFVASGANTAAVTLNLNSLGSKSVTKNGTNALIAGDIPSGAAVTVLYDGVQFQLLNVAPASQPNSLTTSGYQKFSTGLVAQWGSIVGQLVSPGASLGVAVTFPIAFPTGTLLVLPTNGGSGTNAYISASCGTATTTGFTFYLGNSFTSSQVVAGTWIAIGY